MKFVEDGGILSTVSAKMSVGAVVHEQPGRGSLFQSKQMYPVVGKGELVTRLWCGDPFTIYLNMHGLG